VIKPWNMGLAGYVAHMEAIRIEYKTLVAEFEGKRDRRISEVHIKTSTKCVCNFNRDFLKNKFIEIICRRVRVTKIMGSRWNDKLYWHVSYTLS
jgi:hypothetical protein